MRPSSATSARRDRDTAHRHSYDSDNTVFSPQGRLHQVSRKRLSASSRTQVEYALEAVKQGSAAVGLRSNTHVVLLALKRSTGELASYQKKLIRIDDHIGIAIAGLTSDARVLSNAMRQQAMSSRMMYARPIPINRVVNYIAERAQGNTQHYGKRPYGVGFLVAGHDDTGPHLYEFSPSGVCLEYYAMSIGARSQSAKTYLERHFEEFATCSLEELITHGLHALRDTLQQDKELNVNNTSIVRRSLDCTDARRASSVHQIRPSASPTLSSRRSSPSRTVKRRQRPSSNLSPHRRNSRPRSVSRRRRR